MTRSSDAPILVKQDLTVDAAGKVMTEEASTLGFPPGQVPHGWLHPYSTNQGIYIKDSFTGDTTSWYLYKEEQCNGDVVGWRYRPSAETIRANNTISGWTLLIIND